MKEQYLSQIKNDFKQFFEQIQSLINDNNAFKEIITDYIDCKHAIEKFTKKNDKKSVKLLNEYLVLQNDLENEIYSYLKSKPSYTTLTKKYKTPDLKVRI
jgi:prefoldin subunit 5